jgi:sortase A
MAGAACLLAAAAVAEGARAVWIPAKATLAQALLERAWRRALAGDPSPRAWPWADHTPVGRLRAPDHDRDLIVLAGASGAVLAFAPGWLHGTAPPASDGHCVVAGHRDTHFAFLEGVRVGDELDLADVHGRTARYHVVETAVVHERDVQVLADRGVAELTLLTCWPFGTAEVRGPWRWRVRAVAVADQSSTISSSTSSPECSRVGSNRR